jgi:selenocysteine lyase/cysteine desulfurase
VALDGYHAFMAMPLDLSAVADRLFYLGGGYKYAMAGEGAAFLHAPPGFGARPTVTGWFAEFADLEGPPGVVGYARDAARFLGATFDASGLYRLNAVFRMLEAEGLTTAAVADHVNRLLADLQSRVLRGEAGRLGEAEILNPVAPGPRARYLAFRHPDAQAWKAALARRGVVVDVRDDVLRVGLGLYHDEADLDRFCTLCRDAL